MSFRPTVSIIIPVFNGENYLGEAIDSALAQTYSPCEIVVADDGSTDGCRTARLARSYGDRIRLLELGVNRGVASALNSAIAVARGQYISWLSHDDVYLPTKVADQVDFLAANGDLEAVVYGDWEVMGPASEPLHTHRAAPVTPGASLRAVLDSHINGCTLLIPKRWIEQAGGFDERLRYTQDYDLWYRMIRRGCTFVHHAAPLVRYRQHPGQGTANYSARRAEEHALWRRILADVSREQAERIGGSAAAFFARYAGVFAERAPGAANIAAVRAVAYWIGEVLTGNSRCKSGDFSALAQYLRAKPRRALRVLRRFVSVGAT